MTKDLFYSRLQRYVFQDHRTRLSDDRKSLVIAFFYSTLMILLDKPEQLVALQGLAVLGLSMLSFTLYRSFAGIKAAPIRSRAAQLPSMPVTRRHAWTVGIMGAICLILQRILASPQVVHAAVSQALKQMRADEPVSKPQVLMLHSKLREILETHKTSGNNRARLLSDYASVNAVLEYSETIKRPLTTPPNVQLSGSGSGRRTHFVFEPPVPQTMFDICNFAFTNIDFISKTPGSSLASVGRGCNVVITGSLIQNFTQKLDNIAWVDVTFDKCSIIYEGGQLTLVNVTMHECHIDIAPEVLPGIRDVLLKAMNPVTLTSDFVS